MRIAIVSELPLGGVHGVARTLFALLEQLTQRGHELALYAPRGGLSSYCGVAIHDYPATPLPFYPELRAAIPNSDLKRRLAEFRPDVAHLVHPIWFGAQGLYYAAELGYPTVASYHSFMDLYAEYYPVLRLFRRTIGWYTQYVFNQADLVLCPTASAQQALTRAGIQNTHVWGRGVDTGIFNPIYRRLDLRAHLLGLEKKHLLLYVGRLAKEKNVEGLYQMAARRWDARLIIVGDGPDRKRLEKMFAGTGALFAGYLHGPALSQIYASADVFVFPSRTETFGQVVCEAMASGLPVVALAAGAMTDLIAHGQTGLLSRDECGLVAQVEQLLADPDLRHRLAEAGMQAAQQRSWAAVGRQLIDYYQFARSRNTAPASTPATRYAVRTANIGATGIDELTIPRVLQVGQQQVHYRRTGKGPDLVLIHGAGGSWRIWDQVVRLLATDWTLYAVDMIGHGGSSRPSQPWSLQDQADCLRAFLCALDVRPAACIAHSLGCAVAQRVAKDDPRLFERLLLIGGVYSDSWLYRVNVRKFARNFPHVYRAAHTGPLFHLLARPVLRALGDRPGRDLIAHLQEDIGRTSIPALQSLTLSQLDAPAAEIMAQPRPPGVTAIYGSRDLLRRFNRRRDMPLHTILISDAGHFVMLTQPARLVTVIKSCLSIEAV